MRAISLWQPWASLIAVGAKCIETRSWATPYRGPLAIHAAKRKPDIEDCLRLLPQCGMSYLNASLATSPTCGLPRGAIVATCRLAYCVEVPRGRIYHHITGEFQVPPPEPENLFGDYTPGRFAWLLTDIRRLDKPVPWRGSQGFFDVPDELLAAAPSPASGLQAGVRPGEVGRG